MRGNFFLCGFLAVVGRREAGRIAGTPVAEAVAEIEGVQNNTHAVEEQTAAVDQQPVFVNAVTVAVDQGDAVIVP